MISEVPQSKFGKVIDSVLSGGAKKATYYHDEKTVLKATYHGKRRKNDIAPTVIVTVGAPNYRERDFIRKCKKIGEPFPVKKIQMQFEPKKKK